MVASSIFAIMLSVKMNLLATSKEEQELLVQFPLTVARVVGFVASFMASFTELRWYEGTFPIVLAGIFFAVRKRNFAVVPAFLLGVFIFVYACHVRGYYEMESGWVSPESSLRFSMNLMGLWAILGGLGLGGLIRWLQSMETFRSRQRMLQYSLGSAAAMFLLVSFVMGLHLKSYAVEDEVNSRVTPAVVAVEMASLIGLKNSSILTMDPLVVQMYAGTETQIIDLESLDTPTLDVLLRSNSKLLLLNQNDRFMAIDVVRYGGPLRRILALPSKRLYSGERFSVSLIRPDDAH